MTPRHTTNDSPVLGEEIRRLRHEAGFSQQRLATEAGMGMSTLNRAERSDPGLHFRNIVKIANVLGVDPSAIYRDVEPRESYNATTLAPAWAQQQNEQVVAALADIRRTLERIESTLRANS